ncbi:MAG: Phosphoserine phosphatase RsbU [Candidatus Omnitrophica bacterium ADurb.Bin277]|nr:MAG: Phosphoserine phosphatase RsbU [Candidatus Omnitrophica bacterium ADurb.Bin277]
MFKSFAFRLSAVFFLSSVLVLGGLFSFFYFKAAKLRDAAFRSYLENLTETGANLISGEEVRAVPLVRGCEKTLPGAALVKKLKNIQRVDRDISDVYVMVLDEDPGYVRFVTNADQEQTPVECGERYAIHDSPTILLGFKESYADLNAQEDRWGRWVSGFAPVQTAGGETVGILGVDIAQQTVEEIQREFFGLFLISIGACLGFSLLIGLLISFWLTRPIRKVVKGMEVVAGGNLEHKLEHFPEVEFERISGIFNRMIDSLKQMMLQLEATTRENERVQRELEIASEIQQSIFPANAPEVEGLEIEGRSVPAKEVGGDYFDFLSGPARDQVGFIIADASGKGIPGTLYMTRSRSVFKVVASEENRPGETLSRVNNYIAADAFWGKGMFITLLYLIYDKTQKKMRYANAGHYHPLWYKNRERRFEELRGGGVPLGITPGQEYREETIQLNSNDVLVLYTDGVIEARAADGEMFGVDRLKKIIEEYCSLSARELFLKIEAATRDFVNQEPPFDDLTLIVIRVK